jgi:hypothetical protein
MSGCLAWGLGVGLTNPRHKNKLVTNIQKRPRTGQIPWIKDLSENKNGHEIWYMKCHKYV